MKKILGNFLFYFAFSGIFGNLQSSASPKSIREPEPGRTEEMEHRQALLGTDHRPMRLPSCDVEISTEDADQFKQFLQASSTEIFKKSKWPMRIELLLAMAFGGGFISEVTSLIKSCKKGSCDSVDSWILISLIVISPIFIWIHKKVETNDLLEKKGNSVMEVKNDLLRKYFSAEPKEYRRKKEELKRHLKAFTTDEEIDFSRYLEQQNKLEEI